MALKEMAAIVVRPRTALFVGAILIASGAVTGCGHSRTSYRPVYTSPATVAAPCKNCGPSAAVTTEESDLPPVTSVPSVSEPSMLDSTTTAPSRPSSGPVKSRVEPKAKSRLGEPPFDETSTSRDDTTTPPPAPKPLGSGPAVQGPTTLLSPSSRRRNDSRLARKLQLEPRTASEPERAAQALSR